MSSLKAWPRASARDGVEREQLLGQIVDRLAHALLGAQPFGAAELGECRALPARVAADARDLLDRHEDPVAAGERELQVVALLTAAAAPKHLLVARHAVVDVHDEIAGRQALEDVARDDPPQGARPANADGAEELAVGDEGEPIRTADEPAIEAAIDQRDGSGWRHLPHPTQDRHGMAGLGQDVCEARSLVRCHHDPGALGSPAVDCLRESSGTTGWEDRLAPAERVAR